MATLLEALKALHSLPNHWRASWSSGEFNHEKELASLGEARRALDKRVGGRRGPMALDGDQIKTALALWNSHGQAESLPSWAIRYLCNHPPSALDPNFIVSLAGHPSLPRRRSWAEGLIAVHFLHWESTPELELRAVILQTALEVFSIGAPWLSEIRKDEWAVLGLKAPEWLVDQISNVLTELDSFLEDWGLTSQQGLGKEVTLAAVRRWSTQFKLRRPSRSEMEVLSELDRAFSTLLKRMPMGGPFLQTVEDLVLSEWAKTSPGIRDCLLEWCLHHPNLGDPRQNSGNWHPIPLARAKLLSWMARRDLAFFYDKIVPSQMDVQGRKEFWLRYMDQVTDFRIAAGRVDREKIDFGKYAKNEIAYLDGASELSAFILKFKGWGTQGDFICVEFSRNGNALYIYNADVFEDRIAGLKAVSYRITPGPRNIKNRDAACHWQSHGGTWQMEVRTYLNSRGVSPS